MSKFDTVTLVAFWFATILFVYTAWLNWRAYKRWSKAYAELIRDEYLREIQEC